MRIDIRLILHSSLQQQSEEIVVHNTEITTIFIFLWLFVFSKTIGHFEPYSSRNSALSPANLMRKQICLQTVLNFKPRTYLSFSSERASPFYLLSPAGSGEKWPRSLPMRGAITDPVFPFLDIRCGPFFISLEELRSFLQVNDCDFLYQYLKMLDLIETFNGNSWLIIIRKCFCWKCEWFGHTRPHVKLCIIINSHALVESSFNVVSLNRKENCKLITTLKHKTRPHVHSQRVSSIKWEAFLIKLQPEAAMLRRIRSPPSCDRLTNWNARVTRNFPAYCSLFPRNKMKSRVPFVYFFYKCYGSDAVVFCLVFFCGCSFLAIQFYSNFEQWNLQ